MRLSELARMAGRRGATSYLQKQGYALPAMAVGLESAEALARALKAYDDIEASVNRAAGEPLDASVAEKRGATTDFLGGFAGAKPPMRPPAAPGAPPPSPGQYGGQLASHLGGNLLSSALMPIIKAPGEGIAERLKAVFAPRPPSMLDNMRVQAVETLGRSVGEAGAGLLRDLASKALSLVGGIADKGTRNTIIQALKMEDSILAEAPDQNLMEAYHTMVRFAPTLSTDKNAVRSFLRQAVMTGSGPDYASIKLLADSERAVTGGGKDHYGH